MPDTLVPAESQNGWLQSISQITGTITSGAQQIFGAYSSFTESQNANDLAKAQLQQQQYVNTQSTLNALDSLQTKNVLFYGAGAIVAVIAAFALYKAAVK